MEDMKIKIDILPNQFLKSNGTFDKEEAIKLSGKIAGVCYDKEGFSHLQNEPLDRTMRRVDMTLNNGHHSVYDHNKWIDIFKLKIKAEYGNYFNDSKIQKLAQENARYLVTVFMPTQMIYSTSLRQINYIASWMLKYIEEADKSNVFESKLATYMQQFVDALDGVNVLEGGLMRNEKSRTISLFGKDLDKKEEHFGDVYSTLYKGSFAELAQAHRHRTLDYQIEMLDNKEYFVPPIIQDEPVLVDEWLGDMHLVEKVNPQGELVKISEVGKYQDFILKCKERLCSAAQLEIMKQTQATLLKYKKALEESGSPLASDIEKYSHGARCTFPDFKCTQDCKFPLGKRLERKI